MTFNRDRKNFKKIIILSVFSLIMSSGSFFQISADEVDSPSVEYINASQYTSTDSVDGVSNGNDKDVENISIKPLEFTPTRIRS